MTTIPIPDTALQDNTSQRLPCALVLDGSGSMEGEPIRSLNEGLKTLEAELKKDDVASQRVQLLVIRFGDDDKAEVVSEWTDAMAFTPPAIEAHGRTPMGTAVRLALQKIEEQKERYRQAGIAYNRPWLFLISDGEPTDTDWEAAADDCRAAEAANKVVVFTIGVGDAALPKLAKFSSRAPVKLDGLKFKELFVWLSRSSSSAATTTPGSTVQMPSPADWTKVST